MSHPLVGVSPAGTLSGAVPDSRRFAAMRMRGKSRRDNCHPRWGRYENTWHA
jgi:hypothetical protein